MKYIKEYNEEKYYSRITIDEYSKLQKTKDKISDSEFHHIKNSIKSYFLKYDVEEEVYIDSHDGGHQIMISQKFVNSNDKIAVSKFGDEWWGIHIQAYEPRFIRVFYKCDQVSGLMQIIPQLSMVMVQGLLHIIAPEENF